MSVTARNFATMRIAFISDQRLPIRKANVESALHTAVSLAAEGPTVHYFVPRRWRDLRVGRAAYRARVLATYDLTAPDRFRFRAVAHLPGAPFRVDKLTHGSVAPLLARVGGYQVVHTRNSLAAFVALRFGGRVVFEMYRLADGDRTARHMAVLARRSPRLLLVTHSELSRQSLLAAGAPDAKVRSIPNGFNEAHFREQLAVPEARRRVGWSLDERIACLAGRLDLDKGAHAMLALAAGTPEITYVLVGLSQSGGETWIGREAERRALRNVRVLPWVPPRRLAEYLQAADVLVIPPTALPLQRHGTTVLPLKTFGYLAAGRPIVAPALPDTRGVLTDDNAILVEPDDLGDAVEAIRRVFAEPTWAGAKAAIARADAAGYTWRRRAQRILGFVEDEFGLR